VARDEQTGPVRGGARTRAARAGRQGTGQQGVRRGRLDRSEEEMLVYEKVVTRRSP